MFERFFGKRNKVQAQPQEKVVETSEIEPTTFQAINPVEHSGPDALEPSADVEENDVEENGNDDPSTVVETDPEASGEPIDKEDVKSRITESLKTIFDPEIPVNIYDLGLIYEINPRDSGMVHVKMTLTTPNCPAAGILPGEVESKTRSVDGVEDCELELTFDPPWTPDMMSEAAKLELGMF